MFSVPVQSFWFSGFVSEEGGEGAAGLVGGEQVSEVDEE